MSHRTPRPVEFEKLFVADAESARALGGSRYEREIFGPLRARAATLAKIDQSQGEE